MRPIKFRAWDKNEDEYWTWDRLIRCPYNQEYNIMNNKSDIILSFMTDDGLILEQFTGFKDKAGKEVYEGDIVTILMDSIYTVEKSCRGVVRFCNGWFELLLKSPWQGNDAIPLYSKYDNRIDTVEVIGNIHEKPELLK